VVMSGTGRVPLVGGDVIELVGSGRRLVGSTVGVGGVGAWRRRSLQHSQLVGQTSGTIRVLVETTVVCDVGGLVGVLVGGDVMRLVRGLVGATVGV
jgi:hypothetical protein